MRLHEFDYQPVKESLHFVRPGELRGSYTDADMISIGFRRAQNGTWFIDQRRWDALIQQGKLKENAVKALEKDLKNPHSYDAIDHMMQSIAKKHGITGKELHDRFVKKHGRIPDDWIRDRVTENVPQPGSSSGAPTQFAPGTQIQNQQMTAQQIISSIPGVPYYNNVVDDWDAKDYSWGVTKKVIEYAEYLKQHPESLAKLPPIQVVNGEFKDGAHRVSAIWLLQQRMDPKNPLWKNAKLNVQFVKQGVAEASDNMLSEEQPEVRPHRVTDKELVRLLGKGKTNAMLRHPWFQRYNSYEKAYRYARDRWGFVTVDMFPYMPSVNKTADGSIRPTIYVSFIFSYTGPKVVQAHQFRRDQEPDEFEKRNPVTGGWKHGSTWKVDKTDEVAEDAIQEDAVMGKIEQTGKIVRILKKQHTVPFSDETDWLLIDTDPARGNRGLGLKWIPASTRFEWVRPYRDTVAENFADGKIKGKSRPGRVKRAGASCDGSVTDLRARAKRASGEKARMYHWCANMKSGRKKNK